MSHLNTLSFFFLFFFNPTHPQRTNTNTNTNTHAHTHMHTHQSENEKELPPLNEKQVKKLKLLTIASLASKNKVRPVCV